MNSINILWYYVNEYSKACYFSSAFIPMFIHQLMSMYMYNDRENKHMIILIGNW